MRMDVVTTASRALSKCHLLRKWCCQTDEVMQAEHVTQVKLAVSALLAHLDDQSSKKARKNELFKKDDDLWLLLGFRKIPQVNLKPKKIPLPHTLHQESDICLISKEPGKVMREKLAEKNVTCIKKAISLTKLRKEYKTYTLKRQLANSYDLFLCDERIYALVVRSFGKEFFKRRKEPVPVRLTYQDWNAEFSKSTNSTLLRMGYGPCSAIKVGHLSEQSVKELTENVIHAMKVSAAKVPGSWKNVKSFHIKSSSSVALPVYQTSPLSTVQIDEIPDDQPVEKKRKRKLKTITSSDEAKVKNGGVEETVQGGVEEKVEVPVTKKSKKASKENEPNLEEIKIRKSSRTPSKSDKTPVKSVKSSSKSGKTPSKTTKTPSKPVKTPLKPVKTPLKSRKVIT
ncbi:ribosomal L1 domain-containing protein 1-like isoform X2 [Hydractinia symbiolongicarpus]|uniref:ribosomal L1 domain-containing protein 1-like isoform X2 n=1 Tax=Hydractinia symbiolongicarpus TaxID=13093 RepID=UPI00254BF651|nr:ribosomal L1 domain-containing protein 1-like isoform X2 [Hydractinia symbiolongicarpus]